MANAIKWSDYGAHTLAIGGDDSAPTLKNLSSGSRKLGFEIDNTTNRDMYADWDLYVRFASSPAAGGYVELYLVPTVDGTNYHEASDSIDAAPNLLVGVFPVRSVSTQQLVPLRGVLLPPGKCKPLVKNAASTAFTNTDNENVLFYRSYNEEVQ